jgi:hypothetical protein
MKYTINTLAIAALIYSSAFAQFEEGEVLVDQSVAYLAEQEQAPIIRATRLYQAFESNAIRATETYNGKLIILHGKKKEIDVERYGDYKGIPYVDFAADDFIGEVRAYFTSAADDQKQLRDLGRARAGYYGAVWCRVIGKTSFDDIVVEAYGFITENEFKALKVAREQQSNQDSIENARRALPVEVRKAISVN